MRYAYLKIGLFLLLLAAPVGSLLLFGAVESFGRDQPDYPKFEELLRGKGRAQFGDALFERSAAMKLAVKLQNFVTFRIIGFVDTRLVLSGKGEWLFYRPDFLDGACMDLDKAAVQFRQLALLMDLARASGLDMRLSLSPNKSTVYPDELSPLARGIWRCYAQSVSGFRRLLDRELPGTIDHAEPLLAERARNPGTLLFYSRDTHWTPYGGAIALRQLLQAIYPGLDVPPPQSSGRTITKPMDLTSPLLWPVEDQADDVAPLPQEVRDELNRRSAHIRTFIAHDSFYDQIASQVREAFPNATIIRGGRDRDWVNAEIAAADRLIVNLVERDLVRAIRESRLSWDATIPWAIIARNRRAAEGCTSFQEVGASTDPAGQAGPEPGREFAVRRVAKPLLPCLRISLAADAAGALEVALPNPASGAFEPGRAIKLVLPAGSQVIALVLPDSAAGSEIRVIPLDGAAAITAIAVGEIEPPHPADFLRP